MTKNTDPNRRFYLRQVRIAAGMTQEQLAAELGTTKGVVSQLETGHTRYHEEWIEKLCAVFGVSPAAFFEAAAVTDAYLERVCAAWPDIPSRHREALATLAESFKGGAEPKKTAS